MKNFDSIRVTDFKKIASFHDIFVGEGIEIAILIPILIIYQCAYCFTGIIQFYIKIILILALSLFFCILSVSAFRGTIIEKRCMHEKNEITIDVIAITPTRALIAVSCQWIFFVCHYVFIQFLWSYL